MSYPHLAWYNAGNIEPRTYTCGYCGKVVGTNQGYHPNIAGVRIYICPFCWQPTFFNGDIQTPGVAYGNEVGSLPDDVDALYREARNSMAVSSHTAAVLNCRKLLMHIAVNEGAPPGQSFLDYVQYLASKGYIPPHGQGWVDHIRSKGNEANHEIRIMGKADAEELISFTEMLLKFIYEFPAKIGSASPTLGSPPTSG